MINHVLDDIVAYDYVEILIWELAESHPGDGITVLNAALADLGRTQRFRDIWKDFGA